MKIKAKLFASIMMVGLATTGAVAQESAHGGYEELGKDKDWTAIRFKSPNGDGTMSCAIFARPTNSRVTDGQNTVDALRGEKAAFITWESGMEIGSRTGVTSFLMGAPVVPKDAGHEVSVDGTKDFDMFGFEDRVFTRESDDQALIRSIRSGREMKVRVQISDTRIAEDSYSLFGVQAATNIAARACN